MGYTHFAIKKLLKRLSIRITALQKNLRQKSLAGVYAVSIFMSIIHREGWFNLWNLR